MGYGSAHEGIRAEGARTGTVASRALRIGLAVLLAFLLVPSFALQPSVALADTDDAIEAPEASDPPATQEEAEDAAAPEGDQPDDAAADGALTEDGAAEQPVDAEVPEAPASDDPGAGIQPRDQVGVETNVDVTIVLEEWHGTDPATSERIDDRSFANGLNKVCVDRSAHDGRAYARFRVDPNIQSGQDGIYDDWRSIEDSEKYSLDTIKVDSTDPQALRALRVENTDGSTALVFESQAAGRSWIKIDYQYRHVDTGVTYQGMVNFEASAVDAPNEAVALSVPSSEVVTYAYESTSFDPSASPYMDSYYYEYPCSGGFAYYEQQYMVRYESAVGSAPATFGFEELFDISIQDENVISSVYNPRLYFVNGNGVVTGPDSHTYDLRFTPKSAGTTNVTFSLKQQPSQSVTFKVTVSTDRPEVAVADHDMQVGSTQRICVDDAWAPSDASPVKLPVRAKYLSYATSWAKPFVKSLTSSDPSVVEIKPIDFPDFVTQLAPFDIIPLSVGTARITLTDCFNATHEYTITVHPDPDDVTEPSLTIASVKLEHEGSDLSKGALTISTRDIGGKQLTAKVDPDDPRVSLTWTSSNPSVATVDEPGVVRPVRESLTREGQQLDCRITATANGQRSEYCTVVVEAPSDLCAAPADSPLGAATIKLAEAFPADILNELDSVALSISRTSGGAIDDAVAGLAGEGARIQGVYDIHFVNKSDGADHAWNKPQYPLTVQIPMDDGMREMHRHGTLAFYHIDPATGVRTKMQTWVDASLEHIFFQTTHFSPFALVLEPGATPPSTGDGQGSGSGDGAGSGAPGVRGEGPTSTDGPQPQPGPVGGGYDSSPLAQTGDVASKLLAVALLCVSGALVVAALTGRKRVGGFVMRKAK